MSASTSAEAQGCRAPRPLQLAIPDLKKRTAIPLTERPGQDLLEKSCPRDRVPVLSFFLHSVLYQSLRGNTKCYHRNP